MADKTVKQPIFGNRTYDLFKDFVTIELPAIAVLYSGLAAIWGLPYSVEVVGSIAAVATFLGVSLKISSNRFQALPPTPVQYDGELRVNLTNPNVDTHRLSLDKPWNDFGDKGEIRIQVINEDQK